VAQRDLDWPGLFNARDLGGLPTIQGRRTRRGAVVRSEQLTRLTPAGWSALYAHGIRTIIDLRNEDELRPDDATGRPDGVRVVHLPLDDTSDVRFQEYAKEHELDGSPLWVAAFLERKPERCARVITAIARAEPGGVLIHCGGGRDRTGVVSAVLLSLVGVAPDDIAADFELSTARLVPLYAELGWPDQGPVIEAILASKHTTMRASMLAALAALDAGPYLVAAGVAAEDVAAVRERLLEPGC
jgi:protein-tyrosine phosphatase